MDSWILDGDHVVGIYLQQIPFQGVIIESRVKYGGKVSYTVLLDTPIEVYGSVRDRIIVAREEFVTVGE